MDTSGRVTTAPGTSLSRPDTRACSRLGLTAAPVGNATNFVCVLWFAQPTTSREKGVEHDAAVDLSLAGRVLDDVGQPELVGARGGETRRRDPTTRRGTRGASTRPGTAQSEQTLRNRRRRAQRDRGERDEGLATDEREELHRLRRENVPDDLGGEGHRLSRSPSPGAPLGVSRSAYYDWEHGAPSDRELADAWLLERIKGDHASHRIYGWRRIHAELRLAHASARRGKRVMRLMHKAASPVWFAPAAATRRSTCRASTSPTSSSASSVPDAPNVLWLAGAASLPTWDGSVYLAAVQDAYTRRIVAWCIADQITRARCRRAANGAPAPQPGAAAPRPAPGSDGAEHRRGRTGTGARESA